MRLHVRSKTKNEKSASIRQKIFSEIFLAPKMVPKRCAGQICTIGDWLYQPFFKDGEFQRHFFESPNSVISHAIHILQFIPIESNLFMCGVINRVQFVLLLEMVARS